MKSKTKFQTRYFLLSNAKWNLVIVVVHCLLWWQMMFVYWKANKRSIYLSIYKGDRPENLPNDNAAKKPLPVYLNRYFKIWFQWDASFSPECWHLGDLPISSFRGETSGVLGMYTMFYAYWTKLNFTEQNYFEHFKWLAVFSYHCTVNTQTYLKIREFFGTLRPCIWLR